MAGLKTFWILLSTLFLVVACVPQSKQTECKKNEAFNPALRSCVPIIGEPTSFITINDFIPTSVLTKSKADTDPLSFEIRIKNPYKQSYNVRWERVFNGNTEVLASCANSESCITYSPDDLGIGMSQIGNHIFMAKVIAGGKIVDSHKFEVQINDFPKPKINTGSVLPDPSVYNLSYTPNDGVQIFSFTINNNANLSATAGWRTTWTLTKNGALQSAYTDQDPFDNSFLGAAHTNTAIFGDSIGTSFDPGVLGLGTYVIRAIVQNTIPGEVVDEKTWYISVTHPDAGTVTSATSPITSITTTAFHGVDYTTFGFFNENDTAPRPSHNYCVTVSKPQGAYIDGGSADPGPVYNNILVRYYKDGVGSPIYEGKTSAGDSTICFSDAANTNQHQLFFNDGNPSAPYTKKLRARVFDEQSGNELCVSGTACPLVTYPIDWNITVKPLNTAPKTVILNRASAADNITYASTPTASTTISNATVKQDTPFIVRFKITDDMVDHDPFVSPGKYKVTAILKQGTTTYTAGDCNKDWTDAWPGVPVDAGVNAINAYCTITIASSDASGPLAPLPHELKIQVEDLDSPASIAANGGLSGFGGTSSNILTWNLTVQEENAQGPVVSNVAVYAGGFPVDPTLTENTNINFRFSISDLEKDKYTVKVMSCGTDATCAFPQNFPNNTSPSDVVYGTPDYNINSQINYLIPENALGTAASGTIYFKVYISDKPDTVTGKPATYTAPYSDTIAVAVNNWNAPTVIYPADLTAPAPNTVGTAFNVLAGNRFTISTAGAVSDDSAPTSGENNVKYKWWISPAPPEAKAWKEIDVPTTTSVLRWTPSSELEHDQMIRFCVTDEAYGSPALTSDPDSAGANCSPEYYISPKANLSKLTNTNQVTDGALNGEVAIHHVPSERLAYVAYATNGYIYVEKFTYNTDGTLNTSGMRMARFTAVSSAASNVVKNLSVTASNTHVYVAYMADTTTPGSFRTRIRKINISQNAAATPPEVKGDTAFEASTRKFDFSYSAVSITNNCAAAPLNCAVSGRTVTFNGDPLNTATDNITITVPPYTPVQITSAVSPAPVNQICSNCSAADQALSFARAINQHSSTDLQGLTATVSGAVVTLQGVEIDSAYDSSDVVTGMGRIVYNTTTNRWYLPVINASLPGADQSKVQVLSDVDGSFATINTTNVMSAFDKASVIDNALTATNELLLALVNQSGTTRISRVPLSGTVYDSTAATSLTIFSGFPMERIKVKPSPGAINPYVYVVGKTSSEFHVARLPATLGSSGDQHKVVDIADDSTPVVADILDPTSVIDIDVEPARIQGFETSTSEARVAVISDHSGTLQTYLFRWEKILDAPYDSLSCGECIDIEFEGEHTATSSKVALAPIAQVTIGSAGGSAGEDTRNILPVLRLVEDISDIRAELGLINSQVETIDATLKSATGEYRPAYFK